MTTTGKIGIEVYGCSATRAPADFPVSEAAVFSETAQPHPVRVDDHDRVAVYIDLTTKGSVTKLSVKGVVSHKLSPDNTDPADWAPLMAENLDPITGISTVKEYQIDLTIAAADLLVVNFSGVTARWFMPVVWADAAGGEGTVSIMRA